MSTVYIIVNIAIVLAGLSAFIILLLEKLGVREKIELTAPRLISELFNCDFCLSFWISLIFAVILAIIFKEIYILFSTIIATPISRFLL